MPRRYVDQPLELSRELREVLRDLESNAEELHFYAVPPRLWMHLAAELRVALESLAWWSSELAKELDERRRMAGDG